MSEEDTSKKTVSFQLLLRSIFHIITDLQIFLPSTLTDVRCSRYPSIYVALSFVSVV